MRILRRLGVWTALTSLLSVLGLRLYFDQLGLDL